MLPIREAYEWKRLTGRTRADIVTDVLLPIREAYEWKPFRNLLQQIKRTFLLPIREAYEWKRFAFLFFVDREEFYLLPIREAYEWKPFSDSSEEGSIFFPNNLASNS